MSTDRRRSCPRERPDRQSARRSTWRPVRAPSRPTIVVCSICARETWNEYNALRGWQERGFGLAIAYCCPTCSKLAAGGVLDDVPEEATP